MANITRDRNTVKIAPTLLAPQYVANAAATTTYYYGTMQAVDANQRAVNPVSATLKVMGVVKRHVDNSTGAADAKRVELESGEFLFANAGDIGVDDVGKPAYASDNQTVTLVSANGSLCGIVTGVNADSVQVGVGPQYFTA